MIPGGWFKSPGADKQHWRRHGIGESDCRARTHSLDNGSLLPYDNVPVCAECLRKFKCEARIALPKYRLIVAALEKLTC